MIQINWTRLLRYMAVTAVISIPLDVYYGVKTSPVFIAGLGVLVGRYCIRWPSKKDNL